MDNAASNISKEMCSLLAKRGCALITGASYSSNSNPVERYNRQVRVEISRLASPEKWYLASNIYTITTNINNFKRNLICKSSPADALFSFKNEKLRILGLEFPNIDKEREESEFNFKDSIRRAKERNKGILRIQDDLDKKVKRDYPINSKVMWRKFGSKDTQLRPGIVLSTDNVELLIADLETSEIVVRSASQVLKPHEKGDIFSEDDMEMESPPDLKKFDDYFDRWD